MSVVDSRVAEHRALLAFLHAHGEVSMASDVENDFRKVLVVSSASFIEKRLVDVLHSFASNAKDVRMAEALINTAFRREKFSSLFDWGANNINGFLKIFGDPFKASTLDAIASEPHLPEGMKAFLKLGDQRNKLVHNDFADLTFDQTVEEVYFLYTSAMRFVDHLCKSLLKDPSLGS